MPFAIRNSSEACSWDVAGGDFDTDWQLYQPCGEQVRSIVSFRDSRHENGLFPNPSSGNTLFLYAC